MTDMADMSPLTAGYHSHHDQYIVSPFPSMHAIPVDYQPRVSYTTIGMGLGFIPAGSGNGDDHANGSGGSAGSELFYGGLGMGLSGGTGVMPPYAPSGRGKARPCRGRGGASAAGPRMRKKASGEMLSMDSQTQSGVDSISPFDGDDQDDGDRDR
jgi:hypothetical protein